MSQYIIGGVLASSFVQGLLNPPWVGVLGVLVLVASLFKQQFPLYSTKELPRAGPYRCDDSFDDAGHTGSRTD